MSQLAINTVLNSVSTGMDSTCFTVSTSVFCPEEPSSNFDICCSGRFVAQNDQHPTRCLYSCNRAFISLTKCGYIALH
jgi:hypothetical protein